MDAARLISNAKHSSGLSYRSLAADAGIATSTITRIEAQTTDPTFSTMGRLLDSCGFALIAVRAAKSQQPHLTDLAFAWSPSESDPKFPELDWTHWRTTLDQLAFHPELVAEAIHIPPPPSGHPVVDSLLAGVAEKLADDANMLRPSWTQAVPKLDSPFTPPIRRPMPVPEQLANRGVMIDTESLFRTKSTIRA